MADQQLPSLLTKQEFEALPVPEKLDWIYSALIPMARKHNKEQILAQFGIGLGSIILAVATVGSATILIGQWLSALIKIHIP